MEDWKKDGELSIKQGQLASNDVILHLSECVPPRTFTRDLFQVGEPYDHDEDGCALYSTFKRFGNDTWQYLGICRKGDVTPKEGVCSRYFNN